MLLNICYFNTKKLLTAAVIASLLQGFAAATPVFAEVVATGETSNETKVQIAMIFMFAAVSVFVYRRRFAKKND